MKLLFLDVELAPNLATVWGIWNQNIGINQLLETSRILCFSAKWYQDNKIIFFGEYEHTQEEMLEKLYTLMNEAEVICHYNGDKFDIPVINRELFLLNIKPPTSYKSLDLLRTVRKRFRFVSNKLDHITRELGLGQKVKHEGHELWLKCMDKDPKAWAKMEKYNKQDIILLERLYKRVLPWIDTHPNHALYNTDGNTYVCPNCSSSRVYKNGIEHLKTRSYQRYRCKSCGTPIRDVKSISGTNVTLTQS